MADDKHCFTLAINNKLLACRAKQKMITAVLRLHGATCFDTVQLSNCAIKVSEVCRLLENDLLNVWHAIHMPNCSIGDNEIDVLCDAFSQSKRKVCIKSLDLSYNSFTLMPIVRLLQYCAVEKLEISPISLNGTNFNELLLKYSAENKILNFKSKIPLVMHAIIENKDLLATNLDYTGVYLSSCHHFTENSFEFNANSKAKLCNVFFVQHELKKMTMILSIMHIISNSTVKFISFKAGILLDSLTSIIFLLNKKNDCDTFIRVLDISNCKMKNAECKQLFNLLFNEKSALKHIKEFDITNNMLTSVEVLTEALQNCVIEKLLLSSDMVFKRINDSVITEYFSQAQIPNYISGFPLVVINNAKRVVAHKSRLENMKKFATIILMNGKLNIQFYQMIHSLSLENCLISSIILCNCLHINGFDEILSISYKKSFPNVSIFEHSVETKELSALCQSLSNCQDSAFGFVSSEQLFMYRCTEGYFMKALELLHNASVPTVQLINCEISKEIIHGIGIALSTKFRALEKVAFSNCTITDDGNIALLEALFSEGSKIRRVEMLDMSHNKLTLSSFPAMVNSLQHCIIEKMIISDNHIPHDEMADIVISENYIDTTISNFHQGIPLVFINTVKHTEIYPAPSFSAIFWKYDKIDEVELNSLIVSLKSNNILKHHFFLMNSTSNIEPQILILKKLLPISTEIIICKFDLTDEELLRISSVAEAEKCRFVLSSTHFLCSNVPTSKLISIVLICKTQSIKHLQIKNCCIRLSDFSNVFLKCLPRKWNAINFSGCNIKNMGCTTLFNWFSYHKSYEGFIKTLNLSNNHLTSASVSTVIDMLQFCLIENIVVHKNSWLAEQFTKQLQDHFEAGKKILNFFHNIPLVVSGMISLPDKSEQDKETVCLGICNVYATSFLQVDKQDIRSLLHANINVLNIYLVDEDAKKNQQHFFYHLC